jgi:hypothetical protein
VTDKGTRTGKGRGFLATEKEGHEELRSELALEKFKPGCAAERYGVKDNVY